MIQGIEAVKVLLRELNSLEKEHSKKRSELDHEYRTKRAELEQALETIERILNVCKRCHGNGNVRMATAAGDTDWEQCPECYGTGKKKVETCGC